MARCCNTSGAAGCGEDAAHEYISCSKDPSCQVSSHCTTPSFRSLTSLAIICMQAIYSGSEAAMRMPPTLPPWRVFNWVFLCAEVLKRMNGCRCKGH